MALRKVYESPKVFRALNGIINVYKPAGIRVFQVRNAILHNICKDLNELEVREPRPLAIEPGGAHNPVVRNVADLSDHILAVGARHQIEDIRCNTVGNLGIHTSGVLLFGINKGCRNARKLHENRPLRAYHVTGRFGYATENYFRDSRITVRSTHSHIKPDRLSDLCASLQASHQRKMFELCGVDLQSQAAYEIASKGIIRPANNTQPVIYSIKLVDFKRPEFTLEVHAINEDETYLATLVHEIAIELKSVAHCTGIRCIRNGHFTVDKSLLRRHWTLEGVFANMKETQLVLEKHPNLLKQQNVALSAE